MSSHGPHHRAFSVSHQRVILDVQLDGRLRALTEITIQPLSAELMTVHLHSAQSTILSISHPPEGSSPAENLTFTLNEPEPIKIPDPDSVKQYPEAKRRLFERINEKENGELAITIDRSKIHRIARHSESGDPTSSSGLTGPLAAQNEKEMEFEPIVVAIEYQITSEDLLLNHGLCVVDGRFPHVFTNSISARSWIPCVDSLGVRCPWELEFIVPRFRAAGASDVKEPVIVVASGELLEQIAHPLDDSKTVFHYSQAIPISVQQIAWVVGPLKVYDLAPTRLSNLPELNEGVGDDTNQSQTLDKHAEEATSCQIKIHAFCLPNRAPQLLNTVHFLSHASSFFTQEYGSYPYSSYKVVFVDQSSAPHSLGSPFNSATLTIYPSDFLYPAQVIDQVYETKPALVQALARWLST